MKLGGFCLKLTLGSLRTPLHWLFSFFLFLCHWPFTFFSFPFISFCFQENGNVRSIYFLAWFGRTKKTPKIKQDQKKTISLVLAFLRKCVSLDSSVYMSIPSLTFAKIKPRQNATAALFTFSSSTLIQPIKTYDLDDATKQRVCFTSSDSNEIKHVSDYNDSTSLKNCWCFPLAFLATTTTTTTTFLRSNNEYPASSTRKKI